MRYNIRSWGNQDKQLLAHILRSSAIKPLQEKRIWHGYFDVLVEKKKFLIFFFDLHKWKMHKKTLGCKRTLCFLMLFIV